MSHTPLTDAAMIQNETDERLSGELVSAVFARQLEIERAVLLDIRDKQSALLRKLHDHLHAQWKAEIAAVLATGETQ